jgi:hypothetical protein
LSGAFIACNKLSKDRENLFFIVMQNFSELGPILGLELLCPVS